MFKFASLFLVSALLSQGYSLECGELNGELMGARSGARAIYDGEDSVYIVGGQKTDRSGNFEYYAQILKYSISEDKVTQVGVMPTSVAHGGLETDGNGTYYYIGGHTADECFTNIVKLTAENPNGVIVNVLPKAIFSFASFGDNNGNMYTVAGKKCDLPKHISNIYHYNSTSNNADLVFFHPTMSYVSETAAVWLDDAAYMFGGFNGYIGEYLSNIMKVTPSRENVEEMPFHLPMSLRLHTAVAVRHEAYIIGGQTEGERTHHLSRFDSILQTVEEVEVVGFPFELRDATSVYVPKTNKIYIFGGNFGGQGTDRATILYIQLEN